MSKTKGTQYRVDFGTYPHIMTRLVIGFGSPNEAHRARARKLGEEEYGLKSVYKLPFLRIRESEVTLYGCDERPANFFAGGGPRPDYHVRRGSDCACGLICYRN